VVIPLYNQARYLARALGSATWQLRAQDEIIVVDDASTDLGRFDAGAAFRQRVMWIRNPERRGVSYSRNRAIERSRAEWIKFLDADDLLAPFALDAIRCLEPPLPPDVVLVTGGCHRIVDGLHRDYLNGASQSIPRILQENPMLPSATFVRRQALLEVGLFDERIDHEEDWDLWLRLHQRFGPESFVVVDQPICYYCINTQDRRSIERKGAVDGVPVREYFRLRYGASPAQ
jgi:glycosyltransferase involved in cell wall biosynthesis